MPSPSGFLSLPRELRDTIYHLYVFEADGYHFDYESGKLRASGNRPIDLALMYTSTFVAAEMHHLALRSNVLHFSTLKSEQRKAAHFEMFFAHFELCKCETLTSLKKPPFHRYKTPEFDAKVNLRYPQFESLLHQSLDLLKRGVPTFSFSDCEGSSWGEADSVFYAFQGYMIELLSRDTDFLETLADFYDGPQRGFDIDGCPSFDALDLSDKDSQASFYEQHRGWVESQRRERRERASFLRSMLLLSIPEHWTIPSEDVLAQINKVAQMNTSLDPYSGKRNSWERCDWRFSAAAAAIHFFKSISQSTCLGIRNVVLHEDRRSVALPECHVLGLIPFCLQNPQLHIERRVNLWRTLLAGGFHRRLYNHPATLEEMSGRDERARWEIYDQFCAINIGKICCRWISEASALPANGMPADSFSLVLDGDPTPDQSSEVFEIVKEDAAWQAAQAQWYTDQSLSPGFMATRLGGFYMCEVFPQAINDIVEGKSFIRCNFHTGSLYDPKRVLDRNRHINHDPVGDPKLIIAPGLDWMKAWNKKRFRTPIRPSPPLPSLLADLALQDLISEEQQHTA
ncbi:hypothetical protein MMC28_008232 [Mycoblastus sanguinarius]|nr:hypothetical protein [Mycoblastus sanguinarius]